MNFVFRKFVIFSLLISILLLLQACDNDTLTEPVEKTDYERGQIISTEIIVTYTPEQIEQITNLLGIEQSYEFIFDVQVLRIIYQSISAHNTPIRVSGVLMIPVTLDSLPLLCMNHGTVTGQLEVASTWPSNTTEGLTGIWIASMGYYSCLPDYPGFGISEILHPYFHAKSLAVSIIDMIRAAKSYAINNSISLSEQLFLAGYSEGGYATLATHKEIEESYLNELKVTASAPMAGPYDLSQMFENIFRQDSYPAPPSIGFFLTAYNDIYKWNRLNDIFNSPYSQMVTSLFNGSMTYSEIYGLLPTQINLLLKKDFISDYLEGRESEIKKRIEENTLLDWTPKAPIRFFHGNADKISPYFNATNAYSNLAESGGSEVELITINGANHETAGLPCIFGMIEWLKQFK